MTTHQETVERAKADFLRTKEMICRALATTPDNRMNWSPSPTARTPIQQVAHAAQALAAIHGMLKGATISIKSSAEADKMFREQEKPFTTREPVLELLEHNSAEYVQWLDDLTPEALAATVVMPFRLGPTQLTTALSFVPNHTSWHAAQIAYIQTIYGDHAW